uniref:GSVIVT01036958001 n=1 Tax=Arundo donax TaxID=35708 RepID=A0A0A8XU36_ARUDO
MSNVDTVNNKRSMLILNKSFPYVRGSGMD